MAYWSQPKAISSCCFASFGELYRLSDNGIEFGSHTTHHAFLPDLTVEESRKEIQESKSALEKILNHPVDLFSYPGGGFTEEIRKIVIESDYKGAVATHPGASYPNRDPYALKRIRISRTCDNLFVFWFKISGFYTYFEELRG